MVGHWPGSLAQINVVLSVFFAGISGSSTADAASQSKIFIDAQTKEGYDLSFSIAITAVSAVLAVIIPPSILMIVWGGLISTSIAAMYLAGIVPGLLIAGAQMATVHVYAVRRGYPTYPKSTWVEMRCAIWLSLPALITPVIIVGGILLGWFTATESACVAVLYSVVLSTFFYRETGAKELYRALLDTGRLAGVALFCVGTASAFGWLLAYYKIPQELLANVSTWGMGPIAAGFFIAFCFLVVGCFLDAIPAIVIVGTVLEPLARVGRSAPGAVRHHLDRLAGVRAGDAPVRPLPHDRLLDRRRAAALCAQGYDDHAGADAAGAGGAHHLAECIVVPAAPDCAGHAEIAQRPSRSA